MILCQLYLGEKSLGESISDKNLLNKSISDEQFVLKDSL